MKTSSLTDIPPAVSNKTTVDMQPDISKQLHPEALLKRIMYWDPPVPGWVPLKKTKNSTLRFACIAGEGLSCGLAFEGEMLTLTPDNWRQAIQYGKLDFILIESFWETFSGHWYMGLFEKSPYHGELVSLIDFAKERSVPTVFWMTRGHEYHHLYKHCAQYFDLVCCADSLETTLFAEMSIQAHLLLPCVQPALYNPFRHFEHKEELSINMLFDGWADIDRFGEPLLAVLSGMLDLGGSIIESRYQIFRNRLKNTSQYERHILGCTTQSGKITALKYADTYISANATLSTKTTRQWMALEAAASRAAVVHAGALQDDDLRRGFAIECPQPAECSIELARHTEDPLYRERVAHLGWRHVNLNHTFAHRMRTLSALLGLTHSWQEYPKASCITPTMREHHLKHCLETFDQSTYPHKELILVFNGDRLPTCSDLGLSAPRPDVIITQVPGDVFAASALNMGILHASGDYSFRIDDDDYYGPNYILDMILHARAIGADFFGKPRAPLGFEGDNAVYVAENTSPLTIIPCGSITPGLWLGGNTLAGVTEFFHKKCFPDTCYGAADSALQVSIDSKENFVTAFMDDFNIIAVRRKDIDSHTWKIDEQTLKANRKILRNKNELEL